MELGEGALGAVLIEESEPDAEGHGHRDDEGIGALSKEEGDEGGGPEQDEERIRELPQQDAGRTRAVAADGVGADYSEAARSLGIAEAVQRGTETRQDNLGRRGAGAGKVNALPAILVSDDARVRGWGIPELHRCRTQ